MIHEVLTEISADLAQVPGTILVRPPRASPPRAWRSSCPPTWRWCGDAQHPSTVGLGVTGIAGGTSAGDETVELVPAFETVGEAIVVRWRIRSTPSRRCRVRDRCISVSLRRRDDGAAARRLDEDQARLLAQQTVIGSAELLRQSGEDPAELRRKVTSPKGTTEVGDPRHARSKPATSTTARLPPTCAA